MSQHLTHLAKTAPSTQQLAKNWPLSWQKKTQFPKLTQFKLRDRIHLRGKRSTPSSICPKVTRKFSTCLSRQTAWTTRLTASFKKM